MKKEITNIIELQSDSAIREIEDLVKTTWIVAWRMAEFKHEIFNYSSTEEILREYRATKTAKGH